MTWNNRPGSGACEVIDAMKAGKPKKRGNFHTDGVTYFVHGDAIAKRVEPTLVDAVIHKLTTGENLIEFAFRFPRYGGKVAENHLRLFGVYARDYGTPRINHKTVKHDEWYTLAEIEALPEDEEIVPPTRKPKFVNPTMELFPA